MEPLIFQIFTPEKAKAIQHIWEFPEDRNLLYDAISCQILQSDKVIEGHSLNQICLITSRASFADTEEEPVVVASMIFYCLKIEDILPSLIEHRGREFASRAIVSLSFFRNRMDFMCERHGAPAPNYYRKISQLYLKHENFPEIAEHHVKWESFLSEHFA